MLNEKINLIQTLKSKNLQSNRFQNTLAPKIEYLLGLRTGTSLLPLRVITDTHIDLTKPEVN